MRRIFRDFRSRTNPWLGGQPWGCARFLILGGFVILLGVVAGALSRTIDVPSLLVYLRSQQWSIAFVTLFQPYSWLVLLAFGLGMAVCARYVQDVFAIPAPRAAWHYLVALLFRVRQPRLNVEDGRFRELEEEFHLLRDVGGPGFLVIQQGNLVLLEGMDGRPRVCAAGPNYVAPFERVREIISLDDQIVPLSPVRATTRDGIIVEVREAEFAFRLRTGRGDSDLARREADSPYVFSLQAALRSYYNRSVGSGGVTPWQQVVARAVTSAITGYIQQNRLEDLIPPEEARTVAAGESQPNAEYAPRFAREVITQRLNNDATRAQLEDVGAELVWVNMGQFPIVYDRVNARLIETWGAPWKGRAEINLAAGEAQRWALIESGRAEAQAELLQDILEIFNTAGAQEASREELETMILVRTTQILEALSQSGLPPDAESGSEGDDFDLPPPV